MSGCFMSSAVLPAWTLPPYWDADFFRGSRVGDSAEHLADEAWASCAWSGVAVRPCRWPTRVRGENDVFDFLRGMPARLPLSCVCRGPLDQATVALGERLADAHRSA